MKKGTIIAIIVAIALIVTGGILLVLGLSFAGATPQKSGLIQQQIPVNEEFDSIFIETEDCDVTFAMFSGRDDCMVDIRQHKRVNHTVAVEDGTLKIGLIDERKWIDYVGVFRGFGWTGTMEMTVYLPAAEYESLQVRTATGDITVSAEPSFVEMTLRSDTGEISCVGANGDVLDCMTATGDISVLNSAPNRAKLQSDTGDLKLSVTASDEIHMTTNTGDVDAERVNAKMFTCSTDTGEVELERVLAEDYLQVISTTGDVEIATCDAGTVNIETDTGDVSGRFLTPKDFSGAHSDTGRVQVPKQWEGGQCRIETDTGDILFE